MPIYEYVCTECSEELETIQKISDPPLKVCPKCEAETLVKKTSMTSFLLKGGGWYRDGYGDSNKKPETGTTKPEASTKKADTTSKNESTAKPAEKKAKPKSKSSNQSKAS